MMARRVMATGFSPAGAISQPPSRAWELKGPFGAHHLALHARIDRRSRAQGPGQRFEARLCNVVRVLAVEQFKVHAGPRIHREGVEEFLEKLGVDLANLVAVEAYLP